MSMSRDEAFTLILASAAYGVGQTMPRSRFTASGGGLSRDEQTGQEFFSMGMHVTTPRRRHPVELAIYFGRDEFALSLKDPTSVKPPAVWAEGNARFWGPVLFNPNADPDAFVLALGKPRCTRVETITNGEVAGAVLHAAIIMQKAQKADTMISRIGRELKPGAHVVAPTRDDIEFFTGIRDILGPDAVPAQYR